MTTAAGILFLCVKNASRHVGIAVADKAAVIRAGALARAEVYARLTDAELAEMPADLDPVFL